MTSSDWNSCFLQAEEWSVPVAPRRSHQRGCLSDMCVNRWLLEVGLVLAIFGASQIVFDSLGGVSTRFSQNLTELRKLMEDPFVASHVR